METLVTVGSVAGSVISKIKAFHDFYVEFKENSSRCDLLNKRLNIFSAAIEMIGDHDLRDQEGPFLLALQRLERTVDAATAYAKKYLTKHKVKKFIWTQAIKRKFDCFHQELSVFENALQTAMALTGKVREKDASQKLDEIQTYLTLLKNEIIATPSSLDYTDSSIAPDVPRINNNVIERSNQYFDEGRSCVVYQGMWNDVKVAIKELRLPNSDDQNAFEREATFLAKLNDANIVRLYGICTTPKSLMVMEMMDCRTLVHVLVRDTLSWTQCWQIARGAARGMRYLHGKDLLHRDLNTSHILLNHKETGYTAKISGFGMVKTRSTSRYYSASSQPEGCSIACNVDPSVYIAPELLLCDDAEPHYTKECDVYSFGIVLCEMAWGKQKEAWPLASIAAEDLIEELNTKPVNWPQLPNICSAVWCQFVWECTTHNEDKRLDFQAIVQRTKDNK